MNVRIKLSKQNCYLITVFCYFFVVMLNLLYNIDLGFMLYFMGVISFIYCFDKLNNRQKAIIIVFFVSALISMFINNNLNIFGLIIVLSYIGIASLIYFNTSSSKIFDSLYTIGSVLLLINYLLFGNLIIGKNVSVNYASILLLFLYGLIVIYHKKISVLRLNIYAILGLIICFISQGRGGTLGFVIIIVLNNFFSSKYSKKENIKKLHILLLIFTIISLIFLFFFTNLFDPFFEKGFVDNARIKFTTNYLQTIKSPLEFFFGANIQNSLSNYSYTIPHLHNSFTTFYGYFGIYGISLIFYIILSTISNLRRYNKFYFTFFVAFLIRSFTDLVFSNYIGDIFIFYFLFLVTQNRFERMG